MVNVLGLDIGGANTKATFIKTNANRIKESKTEITYFPIWKRNPKQLVRTLITLKRQVAKSHKLDCIAVTMTAELSDAFETKKEGVNSILDSVNTAFPKPLKYVLNINADLISFEDARKNPLKVASANWAATGWMVSQKIENCVIVDAGSTTTSIIPIATGQLAANGKTDLEKLINGELVYTGSLRTNVAAITNTIPIKQSLARVSSELFAQSGDANLILRNITSTDYSAETADGKGKTQKEAMARLARVVCADTEMLSKSEILQIAKHIHEKQIEQVATALNQVYSKLGIDSAKNFPAVVTGIGKDFLARKAAEKAHIAQILNIEDLISLDAALASPAAGVALMAATELKGRQLKWTQ